MQPYNWYHKIFLGLHRSPTTTPDGQIFPANPKANASDITTESLKPNLEYATLAEWSNTAHKIRFVKIHYPLHPYYGKELKVVQLYKGKFVKLKAPDGQVRAIPLWMTDKDVCKQIKESDYPYCCIEALKKLTEIVSCFMNNRC